jgi:hypothetical protein
MAEAARHSTDYFALNAKAADDCAQHPFAISNPCWEHNQKNSYKAAVKTYASCSSLT